MRFTRSFLFGFLALLLSGIFGACGGPECKEDKDCGADKLCRSNKCEAKPTGCASNAECSGATPKCDTAQKTCVACLADADCKAGETCKTGKCESKPTGCSTNAECSGATPKCDTAQKTCVACLADGDCKTGEVCKAGKCEPKPTGCTTNAECPAATPKCDTAQKLCVACLADGDCKTGEVCKAGKCEAKPTGCTTNAECPAATPKCDTAQKICVACLADGDCKTGEVCKAGKCEPKPTGCTTNAECPAATPKCDTAQKLCVACLADGDCKTGEVCQNKTCQPSTPKNCQPACQAPEFCFEGVHCVAPFKDCQADTDCATTETCTSLPDKDVCLAQCDPTKNKSQTDRLNPSCYGGLGECYSIDEFDPTVGVCLPKVEKKRDAGQTCFEPSDPSKPEYHDCKTSLVCASLVSGQPATCLPACDPKKNVGGDPTKTDLNPDCDGGQKRCFVFDDGTGACDARSLTRKAGETCGKTDPADPGYNLCATPLTCYQAVCSPSCDPKKNIGGDATKDALNPDCDGGKKFCRVQSGGTGICDSRALTRKLGETCDLTDPADPGSGLCEAALTCLEERCGKTCDPKQATSCPATDWCRSTFEGSACTKKCDPAQGTFASCGTGFFCQRNTTTYKPGYCAYLPPKRQGTKQLGEDCSNFTPERFCDGSKNLACPGSTLKCSKACDPAQGRSPNPACGAGELCEENPTYSYLGGICLVKGTKKEGEACAAADPCLDGLYCSASLCVKTCDPLKGTFSNTDCGSGFSCTSSTLVPQKGGYCRRYPAAPQGTLLAGAACLSTSTDPARLCDGTKKLFCSNGVCTKGCDISQGTKPNADCATADECTGLASSPWGGFCLATPTQKENDPCNSTTQRCLAGLLCLSFSTTPPLSFCKKECDPSQATNTCSASQRCEELDEFDPTYGACIEIRTQTRKAGEACLKPEPSKPEYNNCVSGQGCDPQTQTCVVPLALHGECTQGVATKPCNSDHTCVGSQTVGKYYCLGKCDPKQPTSCGAGSLCVPIGGGSDGACVQTCTADTDCNKAGKTCRDLQLASKICL